MRGHPAAVGGAPVVDRSTIPHVAAIDRLLAAGLQRRLESVGVGLELWDGSRHYAMPQPPLGALLVADRRTLVGLITNPELHFGEAYMCGRLQVTGGLEAVVEALSRIEPRRRRWTRLVALLATPNTLTASRRNVHHHYDLGNDFYRLWLDEQLVYTCAYFGERNASLEEAQRQKLDLVCRKLALSAADTVVEVGCGWGALALHMARQYGARVKAFNISRAQLDYARHRAAREGLAHLVEFIDDDYRNVSGGCDAFVSIGMLEHVGRRNFAALASVLKRTLRHDGGRGLLHFIGRDFPRPLNAWIRRRIFPGAHTPTIGEVTQEVLEPAGMSVIDVENLRLHYARTLAHWSRRFAAASGAVRATYGEEFRRAWELYLAGSEAAFATGWLQLFQVTFAPSGSSPPYWSRQSIYTARNAPWSNATR